MILCGVFITALTVSYVNAQTSLYIPGFDPQPVSADIVGVGADGRTTWALHAGTPTGTFSDQEGFPGTATLVEGPSDASLTYAFPQESLAYADVCTFSNGLALCTEVQAGSTVFDTETVAPFIVQGGVATSAGAASTSSVSPTSSAAGSQGLSSKGLSTSRTAQTSGSAPSTSPTSAGSSSGSLKTGVSTITVFVGFMGMVSVLMM